MSLDKNIITLPTEFNFFSIFETYNHFVDQDDKSECRYISIFHYISCKKALLFNDTITYQLIKHAQNNQTIFDHTLFIKNFDQNIWAQHIKDIIINAYFLKLSQHKKLKKILSSTHKNILCDPYKLFHLSSLFCDLNPTNQDQNQDQNQDYKLSFDNIIGDCLMCVRDKLTN